MKDNETTGFECLTFSPLVCLTHGVLHLKCISMAIIVFDFTVLIHMHVTSMLPLPFLTFLTMPVIYKT